MLWLARPISYATSGDGSKEPFPWSVVWKQSEANADSRGWEKRCCLAQAAMLEESMSFVGIAPVLSLDFGLAYELVSGIGLVSCVTAGAVCHHRCQKHLPSSAYGCMPAKPGKAILYLLPCIICHCWFSLWLLWILENALHSFPGWGDYTESVSVSYSHVTDHPKTLWRKQHTFILVPVGRGLGIF